MVIKYAIYKEKFTKCKYRVQNHCKINLVWIEDPMDRINYCGNCLANQEEPNLF